MQQRLDWQDCAKGIGIVLVVLGHVIRGVETAGFFKSGTALQVFDFGMYLFHMPLFFFLSGLNVEKSYERSAGQFFKDRAWTIVYPYFLWSVIQGVVRVNLSGELNGQASYGHLLTIFWEPVSQFWFLYALMLCHVAAAACGMSRKAMLALAVGGCLISVVAPYPLEKFLYNFPFYAAGIYLASNTRTWMVSRAFSGLHLLGAAGALVVLGAASASMSGLKFDTPSAVPAGAAGIAMVIIASGLLKGVWRTGLAWLGRMSMTIYILHILAGAGMRVALAKAGLQDPLLHVLAGTLAGVLLPALAHMVFERLGILVALGLKAPARAHAEARAREATASAKA